MSRRCASNLALPPRGQFTPMSGRISLVLAICLSATTALHGQEQPTGAISREVKDVFSRCANAVVKIRGTDQHGEFAGTGFFADPTGTVYTAYSVGGEGDNFTVEVGGKKLPAHVVLADVRSGIALLKADLAPSPSLPIGSASTLEVATPVLTIAYPLDL